MTMLHVAKGSIVAQGLPGAIAEHILEKVSLYFREKWTNAPAVSQSQQLFDMLITSAM